MPGWQDLSSVKLDTPSGPVLPAQISPASGCPPHPPNSQPLLWGPHGGLGPSTSKLQREHRETHTRSSTEHMGKTRTCIFRVTSR